MQNLFDLTGKVAIVTGASSGLGVQYAKALAGQGADVAIVARRYDRLLEVQKEIEALGSKCLPVKCDICKESEIEAAVDSIMKEFGKIDILVNNAGTNAGLEAENLLESDWDKVLNINLKGVFLFSKHVAKYMIANGGGKIVNTASMYGMVGNMAIPCVAYHASKGGVVNMTRALASEWAKYNINVNAIGPGFFESELTKDVVSTDEFLGYVQVSCPMKRLGKPGELNGALIYLVSDAASYTTGQTICVDGGWTAV